MNKKRTLIAFAILICLPSFVMSQDEKGISSCISQADAENQIKNYYNNLNQYLEGVRKKQGQGTARDNINYLFGNQDPQTITEDYRFVIEKELWELSSMIKLSSYLGNFANPGVEVYKLVEDGLSYKLEKIDDYNTINDSTIQLNAYIIIGGNPCIAKFRFIGKCIRSITVIRSKVMSQDEKPSYINEADANSQVERYYISLNQYLEGVRKKQGQDTPRSNINFLFGNQDPQTITEDYRFVTENGFLELSSMIKLSSYLENFANRNMAVYKLVMDGLSYRLKKTNGYKKINDSTIQLNAYIVIDRTPCTARFRFFGDRIGSIIVSKKIPTTPVPFSFNLSAGWKIANGINIGLGLDGLSKNWFWNRMRYGVEFNKLWGDYDPNYPMVSNGSPATMSYKTQNKDWSLGLNFGYSFIGKYSDLDIEDDFRISGFVGGGAVFYNYWYERTGANSTEAHHSSAFYIKPSLRFEWGIWGFETGWYFSAKDCPINGPSVQFILNVPLD